MLSHLSRVQLFEILWSVARQALLSMSVGFSGKNPPPGEPSQSRNRTQVSCLAGGFFTTEPPGKHVIIHLSKPKECATQRVSQP